jgi:hypothetical protein
MKGAVKGALLTGLVSVASLGVATISLPKCASQPAPLCQIQSNEAIASYTAMGPPMGNGCANWVPPTLQGLGTSGGCGGNGCQPPSGPSSPVIGEALGLQTYFPNPNDSNAPNIPGSMAIELEYVGVRIQDYWQNVDPGSPEGGYYPYSAMEDGGLVQVTPQPAQQPPDGVGNTWPQPLAFPFAWGAFDTVHPVNGVCSVSHMTGSKLTYPDIAAHSSGSGNGTSPPGFGGPQTDPSGNNVSCMTDMDCPDMTPGVCNGAMPAMGDAGPVSGTCFTPVPDQPQTTIDYEWSNVKVIVDTNGSGSLGSQVFADLTITQDACSQSFHVSILAPRVQCNGADDAGNPIADDTQCSAAAHTNSDNYPIIGDATAGGQIYGSGLEPGVPTKCLNIYPPPAGDAGANFDFECLPTKTGP